MSEELYNIIKLHLDSYRKQRSELLKNCKNQEDYYSDELFDSCQKINALDEIMQEYLKLESYIVQLEAQISRDRGSLIKVNEMFTEEFKKEASGKRYIEKTREWINE